MCPRIWFYPGVGRMDSPEDGRFFASLRMTGLPNSIREKRPLHVGKYRHAEEAGVKVGQTFLSAHVIGVLSAWIQIDEAASLRKRPRKWAGEGFRSTSNRVDGRFFDSAQNGRSAYHHRQNVFVTHSITHSPELSC